MSIWCSDAQRIIAITQVARGGPGKDYAAKLHDCGANTLGANQVLVGHQACLGHGGGHTPAAATRAIRISL